MLVVFFLVVSLSSCFAQDFYFPERFDDWATVSAKDLGWSESGLEEVVAFAKANEYQGSRDLRIAILEGFSREPFHEILGPTKKRGGPAGMILYRGRLVAQWGAIDRVDMTFSVTKSFLSTVAGLALDRQLIHTLDDKVGKYVWEGTFDGAHNAQITWKHLLEQNSAWQGSLWGIKDWADRPPREGGIDDWQYTKPVAPGTVMEYNDVRVNVLAYSLLQVWRQPLATSAEGRAHGCHRGQYYLALVRLRGCLDGDRWAAHEVGDRRGS
ncbi:serine hydrolase [Croceiramulus getboli]